MAQTHTRPRIKRLYIAHPIAGDGSPEWGDFDRNMERYLRICAYATEQGYAVISWAHHCLTHRVGLTCYRGEDAHEYYLSRDEALLEAADEFWMCAPEGVSRGCDRELRFAAARGIPIHYRVPPGRGPFSGEGMLSPEWVPLPPDAAPSLPVWPLGLNDLARRAHAASQRKGWWPDADRESPPIPEKCALLHEEVAEAFRAYRKGEMESCVSPKGKPEGFPTELADLLIRVGDLAAALGIDLDFEVRRKMAYNETRPHRHGGLKC